MSVNRTLHGDILRADAEALVNTVNCVGFMGRGIALQFRRVYPDNFQAYQRACAAGEVVPGRMFVVPTDQLTGPKFIINFPTKRHWRANSRMEDIDAGLVDLVEVVQRLGLRSIAIPALGCGLGGLRWAEVRPRIERALAAVPDLDVQIFPPEGAPPPLARPTAPTSPQLTTGRAVLVGLMVRYLDGFMDTGVTLLELHKLLYFAQLAGEDLRLRFKAAHYGPYAENLRHVLAAIEGHLLTGYADGGDQPHKELIVVPEALPKARALLAQHPESLRRFERVSALVDGFESPLGMELLASVHWVVAHGAVGKDGAVRAVHDWNPRKRELARDHLEKAYDRLAEQGWFVAPHLC
jgi:O-acetyl-ADP-ribose deacetylase (regulator of RNase III)